MRRILNQAANAAVKHKGNIFEILYRRLVTLLGHNKTIGVVAHRLCHLIWIILHNGVRYEERGPAVSQESTQRRTARMIRTLKNSRLPSRTHRKSGLTNAIFDPVACQEKSTRSLFALWRARCLSDQDASLRTCASRLMVPASLQNRTSICCLGAAKSRRRRLSWCSLPVPKQSEGSLGSCLRRPAGDVRDLAVCASKSILMFFLIGKVFGQPYGGAGCCGSETTSLTV